MLPTAGTCRGSVFPEDVRVPCQKGGRGGSDGPVGSQILFQSPPTICVCVLRRPERLPRLPSCIPLCLGGESTVSAMTTHGCPVLAGTVQSAKGFHGTLRARPAPS